MYKSSLIILQFTPHLFKFKFINSNLSLSLTLSSDNPLKTLGEFAKEAAIESIGYSSIINLAKLINNQFTDLDEYSNELNYENKDQLNNSQINFIKNALVTDISYLWGPPGTG